ncbi:fungal-specific transcription factor domain-containing protein [Mycena sp. CBHHK59/15]|nr:fungal-specific transcription factor domain-containing protein [Mycena sp. CBHHK59/15]
MSSNEEDSHESQSAAASKKRVQRACDMCRLKKRDGGNKCGHCIKHNFTCTYIELSVPRASGPTSNIPELFGSSSSSPSKSYVEDLEQRVKAVEALLQTRNIRGSQDPKPISPPKAISPGVQLLRIAIRKLNSPFPAPHSDDWTFAELDESFRALSIDNAFNLGFQGKSSPAMLVKAAVDLKRGGGPSPYNHHSPTATAAPATASPTSYEIPAPIPYTIKSWEDPAWRLSPTFPPDDLMQSLINLYFADVNPFLPLLHRPTFERGVALQFHMHHAGFAKTLLLVCAVGARYSTDPRVSLPEAEGPLTETAGWQWFDQVKLADHLVRAQPTLYDLQAYCLAAMFLDCTAHPRTSWTVIGFGVRLSQDIGAHRRKARKRAITLDDELEKRAAWILFLFDTQLSTGLGRSIVLQSHDFDIEMPIVCDDEHWAAGFRQPKNTPSAMAYFNCMLTLNRILSFGTKILYSTNRSKMLIGLVDQDWEEEVVVELDSALNTWLDSVPEHLRWDPERQDSDIFFDQSATLYCSYYHTQIIVHRPFIPAMRRKKPTSLPSLSICNTAARACSRVAEIHQHRRPNNPLWFGQSPLFISGIVLLLNIWGESSNNVGRKSAAEKDLVDVHRCMNVLSAQRERWSFAGLLLDTLRQLVAVDNPLYATASAQSLRIPSADPRSHAWYPGEPLDAPMYDPRLETAPPPLDVSSPPDVPLNMYPVAEAAYGHASYLPNDVDLNFLATTTNFGAPDDFTMMDGTDDLNTIALWSRAPNGFEVADWDMYASDFGDAGRDPGRGDGADN